MTTKAIVGYLYRDEYYCPGCIVWLFDPGANDDEQDIPEAYMDRLASACGFDRRCEGTFSQRDFPHTITSAQLDEPVRCDTCMEEIR